jgi:hypothetical protein
MGGHENDRVEKQTATRDLGRLVDLELLHGRGETRGRHYLAGDRLRRLREECRRRRRPIIDPYPWMQTRLAEVESPPVSEP